MQFIQGQYRQQTYFDILEDQVAADNPVRLMDAFIDSSTGSEASSSTIGFPKNCAP